MADRLSCPRLEDGTERLTRLLCEEIVPMFGVPEALLSDRRTNLLSHLMLDVCKLLGIEKLNTSYHPECDGMIERLNRTLKAMLRKRAAQFGTQWDNHLAGMLWAYRNTPHGSSGEKPSFLLFGWDCRSPTEAALNHLSCIDSHPSCDPIGFCISAELSGSYRDPGTVRTVLLQATRPTSVP